MLTLNQLKEYCLSKMGAYEDYPFGESPIVFKINKKMFALVSPNDAQLQISLKCEPLTAQFLRAQYTSVVGGYHLNKEHWNTVYINGTVPDDEVLAMIDMSYDLVKPKVKKQKNEKVF